MRGDPSKKVEDHIGQVILRRRLATTCLLSMGLSSLGLLYFRSYTRHSYLRLERPYLRSSFEDAFLKFEQLLLPLSHFLSARTVMLKWMESLRPPRTNYSNRRRRRKRSSSDSEDHQIRRHRKRTKIDMVRTNCHRHCNLWCRRVSKDSRVLTGRTRSQADQ